ncbi:MAG: hypothetical protein ACYTGN_04175 [Planctomycetota bacterium]
MKNVLLVLLLCAAACTTAQPSDTEIEAKREDVTASLYRQLDLVLARQEKLADEPTQDALNERSELLRLAAEIAIRIVRIDPQADGQRLVDRITTAGME